MEPTQNQRLQLSESERIAFAVMLRKRGLSCRDISDRFAEKGCNVAVRTVFEWCNRPASPASKGPVRGAHRRFASFAAVVRARELSASGMSYPQIANALADDGYKSVSWRTVADWVNFVTRVSA